MAITLAIANQKGGVGKTTTAVNLSAALRAIKKRVLLIDIDPQGNATMGCGVDKHTLENSVCELLLDECDINKAIVHVDESGIDVLGSNTDLIAAEVALLRGHNSEYKLKNAIRSVASNYDYVIIDCPPSLNMLPLTPLRPLTVSSFRCNVNITH